MPITREYRKFKDAINDAGRAVAETRTALESMRPADYRNPREFEEERKRRIQTGIDQLRKAYGRVSGGRYNAFSIHALALGLNEARHPDPLEYHFAAIAFAAALSIAATRKTNPKKSETTRKIDEPQIYDHLMACDDYRTRVAKALKSVALAHGHNGTIREFYSDLPDFVPHKR